MTTTTKATITIDERLEIIELIVDGVACEMQGDFNEDDLRNELKHMDDEELQETGHCYGWPHFD